MSDIFGKFIDKKKSESAFLSLEDGESAKVLRLKSIKEVTKSGFGGEEKSVLRLKCEVMTSEGIRDKDFDNGTQRFAMELQEKGIDIGYGFTITRTGQQTKTRYTISDVVAPQGIELPKVEVAGLTNVTPTTLPDGHEL
jgi:hypothetical protein